MTGAWIVYALAASATIVCAALLAEWTLRASRRATRVAWIGAILFALLPLADLPLLRESRSSWLDTVSPSGNTTTSADKKHASPGSASALLYWSRPTIRVSSTSRGARFDTLVFAMWTSATAVIFGLLLVAVVRLRRVRTSAVPGEIDGVHVLIAEREGPFVVGVFRPRIVIPRWVVELPQRERRLAIAHEEEHLRARDPALLMCGSMLVAVMPWNPALWFMLGRLRRAIEGDCDHRVLGAGGNTREYAELLLSVAGRTANGAFTALQLTNAADSLEWRIRYMTVRQTPSRPSQLLAGLVAIVLLVAALFALPRPIAATSVAPRAAATTSTAGGRATGRIHVTAANGRAASYRIYSTGGGFADAKEQAPRSRADTIETGGPRAFNVDVTDGDIHIVSTNTTALHVEAAMLGDSPALWTSGTGRHVVLMQGGVGVRKGRPRE